MVGRALYVAVMFMLAVPAAASAQTEPLITVQTDDNTYYEGETIVISGEVRAVIGETPVLMQLFSGGSLVDIAQISVAQDGSYSHTIIAAGKYWTQESEYLVMVSYGNSKIETQFDYYPETESTVTTDIFEVDDGSSGTFDVTYTIQGGAVSDISIDQRGLALVVEIDSADEGRITLELPRDAIDARDSQSDIRFIILIDDIEVDYEESSTGPDLRVVTVNFEEGDGVIRIIGTFVIPEFGALAAAVLAASAASVLLARARLRVMAPAGG